MLHESMVRKLCIRSLHWAVGSMDYSHELLIAEDDLHGDKINPQIWLHLLLQQSSLQLLLQQLVLNQAQPLMVAHRHGPSVVCAHLCLKM